MIQELQNFRTKYPGYDDLDDLTLATKLSAKYPQYTDLMDKVKSDQPPEQPIIESGFQFGGGASREGGAVGEWEKPTFASRIVNINEAIEAGEASVIKNAYNTISGLVEFSRKQWEPTRKQWEERKIDGVAIKDMPVISPKIDEFLNGLGQKAKQKFLQSDYVKRKERIMKAHPIATKVGEFGSDIGLLVAVSAMTKSKGSSPLLLKLAIKHPKIALMIKSSVRSGKVWGITSFIKELSRTKDLPKAFKVGGKSAGFGALLFGPSGALENPIGRTALLSLSAHTLDKIPYLRAKHQRGEKLTWKDFATPSKQTLLLTALSIIQIPAHQKAIKAQRTATMKAAKQELYREPKSYKEAVETLKKAERVILPGGKEISTRKAPELATWNKATKSFVKPEGKIVPRGSKMIDVKGKEVYEWNKTFKEYRPIRTEAGKAPKVVEVRVEKKIPVKVGDKEQILKIAAKEKVTLARAKEILKQQIKPAPIKPTAPVKSISKELESLAKEAKKYKSAEEFVAGQKKVYHGTSKESALGISKEGGKTTKIIPAEIPQWGEAKLVPEHTIDTSFFVTSYKETALKYAKTRGKVVELFISPNAKIADYIKYRNSLPKNAPKGTGAIEYHKFTSWAKKQGYDIVDVVSFNKQASMPLFEDELVVFNPSVLKTKAQLTDIYNKATVPVEKAGKVVSFDKMITFKAEFERGLKLDRSLEAYGAIVKPQNVYESAKKYSVEQLKALSKWYKQRTDAKVNPAQITVYTILDSIIEKPTKGSKVVIDAFGGLRLPVEITDIQGERISVKFLADNSLGKTGEIKKTSISQIRSTNIKDVENFINAIKKDLSEPQLVAQITPTKKPSLPITPSKALKQAVEHTIPAKSLKIGDMFLHPSGEVYKVIPTPRDGVKGRVYIQDGKKRVVAKSDDIHLKGAVNDPLLVGKAGMMIHGEEWTEGFADIEKKPAKLRRRVLKTTGIKKVEIPVKTTEMMLLKARLKAEARGAKVGERIGRIETKKKIYTQLKTKAIEAKELQKTIIDYANENLTKIDRDKIARIASKAVTKHRLARAVTLIDKMEEKYQRHVAVDSLKDTINDIDFKRLRPEYKASITAMADSIDLVNRREKTIKGLVNMNKYIQREPNNNIPEKQLNRLAILTRTPIKKMTTDDITLIDVALKSLVKQHELKGKLIIKGKIRDFVESRNKAVGNIRKKELVDVDPREGLKVSRAKQLFTTDAMNAEYICKQLDKEERGVIKEVLYDNLDNGVSEVLKYEQEANDYFWKDVGDILQSPDYLKWDEAYWTKKQWAKNVDYQYYKLDSSKTLKITKEEKICINLDSRNENNLRRVLEGGYRLRNNPTILYKITANDLAKIKLTPKEQRVADARYKYFNTIQKEKLNKKSVELNGWEVATENDYFPMADRIYGIDIHKDYLLRNEALPSNMRQFTQSTLEGMGALKERIANINPLILESAGTITYKSVKQTATYFGLADPLRNAKALLFDPTFKTSITTRYSSHYWQSLANYIRDMEGEYQRTDNVDKIILEWINKLDVAVLGMNPFVMAKQPISLMAAAVEMDSKYIAKALKPESKEVISKHSPQLRDRLAGNVTRELGEIAQTGQVRHFWTRKSSLSQKLMAGIKRFDYEAIGRIWKAVEYETNDLYPNLTGEAKMKHIAQRTEEVVRLTQPTFHIKDRSAIGRSKSVWVRLATKYTSQRNKNYMMIMRTIDKYNNSDKGTKAKRNFMKGIAIVSVLMPLMLYGIDELRNWLYKRKPSERKIRYRILKFLEYNLGNVYFVGNAFRMFTSGVERGEWFGYGISDIVTSTGEQGVKSMINAYNAIDQAISQEKHKSGDRKGKLKWKQSALRATNQAISFGTRIRGIPYDTIRKLLMVAVPEPKEATIKRIKAQVKRLKEIRREKPSKAISTRIEKLNARIRELKREAQR